MKRIILLLFAVCAFSESVAQTTVKEDYTVEMARLFSSDIFELNGVPYLSPLVKSMNATSNARFFHTAYVPREVDVPYFKFSINGMLGFVNADDKYYMPRYPAEEMDGNKLARYARVSIDLNEPSGYKVNILDTAGLIYYAMKTVLWDGLQQGRIAPPEKAATILGNKPNALKLPKDVIDSLVKENPIYAFLAPHLQDTISNAIQRFPGYFTLPNGSDMGYFGAGVPQLEIGSFYGTELLLRFIPPIYMGENIGDFAFWGLGLKHSISQYFYDNPDNRPFDMAVQAVYQGTYMKNEIGETNAQLEALADIWNINLQFSKDFDGYIELFTGFSYELLNITSEYKYYLPVEVQWQLGLLDRDESAENPDDWFIKGPEPPEFPGDTKPQKSTLKLSDENFKWIIGVSRDFGPVSVYADCNVSQIMILSAGILYNF